MARTTGGDNTGFVDEARVAAPGVFGAASGENTPVTQDAAGNTTTVTFTLR